MKAYALRDQLLSRFPPGSIEMEFKETPGITGAFEVIVDGKVVHSKQNGDGFVDDEKKVNKIADAVRSALAKPNIPSDNNTPSVNHQHHDPSPSNGTGTSEKKN